MNQGVHTEGFSPSSVAAGDVVERPRGRQYFWVWVLCLMGLDYFSTLAYQPSITYEVSGRLGPLATGIVVLVTLAGVLPVYLYLAGRSPLGHGSIGMLERVVHGWRGKTLVLLLLGFAATDFVMLKTISLADAAEHLRGGRTTPWQQFIADLARWCQDACAVHLDPRVAAYFDEQLMLTLLLGVVGFLCWFLLRKGFNRNVIGLAVPLVTSFLVLNGVLIGAGVVQLVRHPEIFAGWAEHIYTGEWDVRTPAWLGGGWLGAAFVSLLFLPHLALGLSGFEMSMILMPQIRGEQGDDAAKPQGRIKNTRKVLIVAAVIMSVYLLGSSFVTTLLIPPAALAHGGAASHRALAYLAHGEPLVGGADALLPWCGPVLGTVYDVVTVLMLSLAGTSVMTALAVLLPQFLLRFGMELRWTYRWGVLLMAFAAINLLITLYFRASVDAQRGAYTTSVLVLMSSGAIAGVMDRRQNRGKPAHYFTFVAGVLVATTVALMLASLAGLLISGLFIVAILGMSVLSRAVRADEMRTIGLTFRDEQSKFLWDSLRLADFPVLVPHRPGKHERDLKEAQIRQDHQLAPDVDIVFLEVEVDDPSNFYQVLMIEVVREDRRFVIKVTRCVSVAHAIAAVALEMSRLSRPPGLHFGWSELDLLSASWNYFAFGEGNVPWKVRELICFAEPNAEKRPRVIIG